MINAVPLSLCTGMSFGGYRESFMADVGLRKGKEVGMAWRFESSRLYSPMEQKERREKAEEVRASTISEAQKKVLYSSLGCRGRTEILSQLSYADTHSTWVLGVAHTFLFGVAKNFIHLLLGLVEHNKANPSSTEFKLTKDSTKEVSARCTEKQWTLDNDFGRGFKDITVKPR